MTILETILNHKREEVEQRKELYPVKLLEKSSYFHAQPVSLKRYLTRPDKLGVIAEIKRKSPSKGDLNKYLSVEKLSIGYMQAGASALSILTDTKFFGGANEDLTLARKLNFCPILRKDFVIDDYQIIEARSIGADAILLIASALQPQELKRLAAFAQSLQLEVLLEVHDRREIEQYVDDSVDIVGINNRNLHDFTCSIRTSLELADALPREIIKVSESGINSAEDLVTLRRAGFQGYLIGETFMRSTKPEKACAALIAEASSMIGDESCSK